MGSTARCRNEMDVSATSLHQPAQQEQRGDGRLEEPHWLCSGDEQQVDPRSWLYTMFGTVLVLRRRAKAQICT